MNKLKGEPAYSAAPNKFVFAENSHLEINYPHVATPSL